MQPVSARGREERSRPGTVFILEVKTSASTWVRPYLSPDAVQDSLLRLINLRFAVYNLHFGMPLSV